MTHTGRRMVAGDSGRDGRRRRYAREVLLVGTAYVGFSIAQTLVGAHPATAAQDAGRINSLEALLHVAIEPAANALLAAHPVLSTAAGLLYVGLLLPPSAILVWCLLRHPAEYGRRRTVLLVLTGAAVPVFALFPAAPPRLAMPGIVDVVAGENLFGPAVLPGGMTLGDVDAAMPSLHVAWACWCAWAAGCSTRVWVRRLAVALPVATAVDVVATGNHYVLDVVAGAGLVVLAVWAHRVWERCRGRRRRPGVTRTTPTCPRTAWATTNPGAELPGERVSRSPR